MQTLKKNIPLLNIALSLLCILMLVCQFLPFWSDGEVTCSMQGMLWFPNDQGGIPNYISDNIGTKFDIDSVVWLTLLTFLCCVLGAIFCLIKRNYAAFSVFPLIAGVSSVINYLTRPALRIGSMWEMHLIVGILLCICAVLTAAAGVHRARE